MTAAVTALPPEIQIEDDLDGVRYILGRRPPGTARKGFPGFAFVVFGAMFSGFSLLWITAATIFGQAEVVPPALRWLFPLFGVPFFVVGQVILAAGLYVIRGRAEILVRDGKLSSVRRAGPYRWTTSRSADSVLRLETGSTCRSLAGVGARGVKVHCDSATPIFLAVGYPLDWQEALAFAIGERLGLGSESVSSRGRLDEEIEIGPSGEVSLTAVLPYRRSSVRLDAPGRGARLASTGQGAVGLAFLAAFWNGITWTLIILFWLDDDASGSFVPFVVLGIFALIGLVMVFALAKTLLARAKLQPGVATASVHPVCLGESLEVRFTQRPKSTVNVRRVALTLLCRESATYRQGTNTYTKRHDVHTDEREVVGPRTGDSFMTLEGEETFQIPPEGMHSFEASRNQVTWMIETKTELAGWPDFTQQFELEVAPLRIAEDRGGDHVDQP